MRQPFQVRTDPARREEIRRLIAQNEADYDQRLAPRYEVMKVQWRESRSAWSKKQAAQKKAQRESNASSNQAEIKE